MRQYRPKKTNSDANMITHHTLELVTLENANNEHLRKRLLSHDDFTYKHFNQTVLGLTKHDAHEVSIKKAKSEVGVSSYSSPRSSDSAHSKTNLAVDVDEALLFKPKLQLEILHSQINNPFNDLLKMKKQVADQNTDAVDLGLEVQKLLLVKRQHTAELVEAEKRLKRQ